MNLKIKHIYAVTLLTLTSTLVACGGGSDTGSAATANNAYTGARTLAALNSNNQQLFYSALELSLLSLSETSELAAKSSDPSVTSFALLSQRYARLAGAIDEYIANQNYQARTINDSVPCTNGGSITISGTLNDQTNTGTLNVSHNQCAEDDVVINSVGTLTINKFDTNLLKITDFTVSGTGSTLYNGVTYTETGVQQFAVDHYNGQLTAVSNITRKAGGLQLLENNLVLMVNQGNITFSGQLCEGVEGCVNITTPTPWSTSDTTGETLLSGANNSKIRIRSVSGFEWLDLDANGDGIYETTTRAE